MGLFGKRLAVKLTDFLGDMLDEVDAGIALDAVVVADIVEPLLELGGELLHGRDRRIDSEADMALHAVGGIASKVDDLLTEQGRLADERHRDALFLSFLEEAGTLFFVDVDEDRIRISSLDLDDVGGEVGLAG